MYSMLCPKTTHTFTVYTLIAFFLVGRELNIFCEIFGMLNILAKDFAICGMIT